MSMKSFITKLLIAIMGITATTDKIIAKSQLNNATPTTTILQQVKKEVPSILKKVKQIEIDYSKEKPYSVKEKNIEITLNKLHGIKQHLLATVNIESDQKQKNLIFEIIEQIKIIIDLFQLVYEFDLDEAHIKKGLTSNRNSDIQLLTKDLVNYFSEFQQKIGKISSSSVIRENKILLEAVKELAPFFIIELLKDMYICLQTTYSNAKNKPTKTNMEILLVIFNRLKGIKNDKIDSFIWNNAHISEKKMHTLIHEISTFLNSNGYDKNYGVTTKVTYD